jgi:hypothetical protein
MKKEPRTNLWKHLFKKVSALLSEFQERKIISNIPSLCISLKKRKEEEEEEKKEKEEEIVQTLFPAQ